MNIALLIAVVVGVGVGVGIGFLLLRRTNSTEDTQGMMMLQNQLADLAKAVDSKLGENRREMTESVHHQFSQSQQLLKDIS